MEKIVIGEMEMIPYSVRDVRSEPRSASIRALAVSSSKAAAKRAAKGRAVSEHQKRSQSHSYASANLVK